MAYATRQDIENLYGLEFLPALIGDLDTEGETQVSDVAINKALSSASEYIDSYASSKYETPLPASSITDVLKTHCINIAVYNMADEGSISELIKDRYNEAKEYLYRISKGVVKLTAPSSEGSAPKEQSENDIQVTSKPRRFERGGPI